MCVDNMMIIKAPLVFKRWAHLDDSAVVIMVCVS